MTRATLLIVFSISSLGIGCKQGSDAPARPIDSAPPHSEHGSGDGAAFQPRLVQPRVGTATLNVRSPAAATWDVTDQVQVTTQLGGQIRRLALPRLGEAVAAGALVAELYSPQARGLFLELLVARDLGEPWLAATRTRLERSGITADLISQALEGRPPDLLPIRARRGGVVAVRPVSEGAWVGAGATLAMLADPSHIVVDAVVSGALPDVGSPATIVDSVSGERWDAVVESILAQADVAGIVVRLRPEGAPRVGRPLIAEWSIATDSGSWLPRSAVVDTGQRRVVFVDVKDHGISPREVTLGARTADEVQILSGLEATDMVVAEGTFLYDSETQVSGAGHAGMTKEEGDR